MRRLLPQLLSHPISAIGVVLAVASGCVFLGLVALHILAAPANPYADIVVFVLLPPLFALGLLLMPIGLRFYRKRARAEAAAEPAWSSRSPVSAPWSTASLRSSAGRPVIR
jgi:hypothetical protein